ncbi:Cupredoxin_1 domain-containing protein [Nitrospira tepida]|uniref:Cupredoxin_1 domain-containing protein n=1 Tax=Nitrospira tepida TaxID=2973512 RepID=A0AA86N3A2_9BACT|nr:cupredoxin domain-containing protein [Nitrospira tepida]CAI4033877.1 Cupredoxin_1 domain-containing protein [Nitrospira tepida]
MPQPIRILFTAVISLLVWLTQASASGEAVRVVGTPAAQPVDVQRIEITMQEYAFMLGKPGTVRLGVPTAIILRNHDIVRHGFTAPVLAQLGLSVEGEGVSAYGTGIEGVYVDPGKTLVIYFTPERGGNYSFRCDLHQQMKGELYTLELPSA